MTFFPAWWPAQRRRTASAASGRRKVRSTTAEVALESNSSYGQLVRRALSWGTAMSLVIVGALTGIRPDAAAAVERPNVVVFVTDDQPRELITMPKTRSWFQSGGTDFANAWVTTPLCCPSRASILSGRYAHNTGVHTNSNATEVRALDQNATIERLLHDDGYHTAITGKYLNSWNLSQTPPNWDRFAFQTSSTAYTNPKLNVDGTVTSESGFEPDILANFAKSYLDSWEADDTNPWFLYVATNAPHSPYTAAPRYQNAAVPGWNGDPAVVETDRSDKPPIVKKQTQTYANGTSVREQQLRSLMAADDMVDNVMTHLEALGETNTLALFISDNGLMWGEHGVAGQKRLPYPQSAGVPLLARWPGHVAADAVDPRFAANIDLAPTIAEAAGITPDYTMDGESLLDPPTRDSLLLAYWRSPDATNWPSWAGIVTPTEAYTQWYQDDLTTVNFREDYDLTNDPWENQNLLADGDPSNDPDTSSIAATLHAARTCTGSACLLDFGAEDLSPPTVPSALTTWERIDGVGLGWTAATDDVGIAAYDIYRDGALVKSVGGGAATAVDTMGAPGTASQYTVVARDAAGNASGPSDPATGAALPAGTWLVDAFETGSLGAWWSAGMSAVNGAHSAAWAARATSTGTPSYARASLPTSVGDAYVRAWIRIDSRSSTTRTTLLRMVKTDKTSLMEVDVSATGQVGYLANATNKWRWGSTTVPIGVWTELEVRTVVGTTGSVALWVNGAPVLSRSDNTGTSPISKIQMGD